jgi:hypothetical protein
MLASPQRRSVSGARQTSLKIPDGKHLMPGAYFSELRAKPRLRLTIASSAARGRP